MAVTPAQVGVEVGIPTPTADQETQWQSWLDQTYYLIERRYGAGYTTPTEADADYVVLQVVASRVRNVDFATQVDVAVDDGRISRRYSTDGGRTTLDDWWDFLDPELVDTTGGAFTISPTGEADVAYSDSLRNWRDVYNPDVE
jgi:hypothetical protein